MIEKHEIEYSESFREPLTPDERNTGKTIGKLVTILKKGTVTVEIDMKSILSHQGGLAMRSKSGVCRDGFVKVKRATPGVEISRTEIGGF